MFTHYRPYKLAHVDPELHIYPTTFTDFSPSIMAQQLAGIQGAHEFYNSRPDLFDAYRNATMHSDPENLARLVRRANEFVFVRQM